MLGFILTIIGWVLLGILGIILGILLFVLFSAIRYQIDGEKRESLTGQVKITWLLWILSVQIRYQQGLSLQAALLGHTIWQMGGQQPEKEKKRLRPGRGPGGSKPEKKGSWPEELLEEKEDWSEETSEEKENWPGETSEERENWPGETSEEKEPPPGEPSQEKEAPPEEALKGKKGRRKADSGEKKKIRFSFSAFCDKLKQGKDKLSDLREKWECLTAFLSDPENQRSAKLILRQIKKCVLHLLPRKGKGELTFGLEDPYLMGKALSLAALAYPFTHGILTLHPVFDQKLLEGELHVKGHIRIGVLLGYVLRLLFDGNIRRRLWKLIRRK